MQTTFGMGNLLLELFFLTVLRALPRPNVAQARAGIRPACIPSLRWVNKQENKGQYGRHTAVQPLEKGSDSWQDDSFFASTRASITVLQPWAKRLEPTSRLQKTHNLLSNTQFSNTFGENWPVTSMTIAATGFLI
jgi:hypothetical protein